MLLRGARRPAWPTLPPTRSESAWWFLTMRAARLRCRLLKGLRQRGGFPFAWRNAHNSRSGGRDGTIRVDSPVVCPVPAAVPARADRAARRRGGARPATRASSTRRRPGPRRRAIAAHVGEVVAVDVEPEMLAQIDAPNMRTVRRPRRGRRCVVGPLRPRHRGPVVPLVRRRGDVRACCRSSPISLRCSATRSRRATRSRGWSRSPTELLGERAAEAAAQALPRAARRVAVLGCRGDRGEAERTWTAESLIGLAYSTSVASPERLGAKRAEFERRVHEAFGGAEYHDRVSVSAVLGRRGDQ